MNAVATCQNCGKPVAKEIESSELDWDNENQIHNVMFDCEKCGHTFTGAEA